jgi:cytoskeletal protein RodZ
VSDKSAAVLPITPRSRRVSSTSASTVPSIAPAEFGEHLLRGREQKHRSLEEIADTTKISMHQLRALERGDLHRLPGGIYRRAIVRQYAEAIGLNVEEAIRDLDRVSDQTDVDIQSHEAAPPPRADAGSSPFPAALWSSAAALVAVAVVAAVATLWYRAGTADPAVPAPVPAATAMTPETEAPAVALVAATDPVPSSSGNVALATEPPVSQTPTTAATAVETNSPAAPDATEGELRITSEPAGALVTVNGVGWGPTPVTIQYMPFGKKLIRASKPGYVSAQRVFDFAPDRRGRSVRIQLIPESSDVR